MRWMNTQIITMLYIPGLVGYTDFAIIIIISHFSLHFYNQRTGVKYHVSKSRATKKKGGSGFH